MDDLSVQPPLYHLNRLTKLYENRHILDIPALTIQPGEIVALVGPSGAGKSTLLRMLALLEGPTGGELILHLNGQPVTHQTANIEQRRQVGMVFQRPVLLSRSVWDNVAYGLRLRGLKNQDARIENILRRVCLLDLAQARPDTLSGGEMQRVALARTLVLEPPILLLDEPTANLDPANVRIIETLIREHHTAHQMSMVLVTHNIFQARRLATRVALLLDGMLVEVAPVEQFFNAPQDQRTADFISGDLIY